MNERHAHYACRACASGVATRRGRIVWRYAAPIEGICCYCLQDVPILVVVECDEGFTPPCNNQRVTHA